MDSEDAYDHSLAEDGDEFWRYCDKNPVPMKLYEEKIRENLALHHNIWHFRNNDAKRDPSEHPATEGAEKFQLATCHAFIGFYHTLRLFGTIKGFHTGELDLIGRHRHRYERMRARFDEISNHFMFVSSRCTVTKKPRFLRAIDPFDDVVNGDNIYTFDPPDLWDKFVEKWHISSMYDLKTFQRDLDICRQAISQHRQPRYQMLLLLNLPPELLDQIMSVSCTETLKLWSMTCKTLRECATYYCYEICDYNMDGLAVDWAPVEDLPDNDVRLSAFVQTSAIAQRDALVERMRYIAGRKDIIKRIRSLSFVESWTAEIYRWANKLGCSCYQFISPLLPHLVAHMRSPALASFTYISRYLWGTVWKALGGNSSIHTLELITNLPRNISWSPAPNIRNLEMTLPISSRGGDVWDLVILCPAIIFLRIGTILNDGAPLPARIFTDVSHNPMKRLRRFDFKHVDAEDLVYLATAIEAAGAAPLTHLSITAGTDSHIKKHVAFALARSLRFAPSLRVLHIVGLQYARADFLALLGENVPGLHALVLQHRPSTSRCTQPHACWPCPSYEYAPHLAAFSHLEHLAMNMAVVDHSYASQCMVRMESEYRGAEDADCFALLRWSRKSQTKDSDEDNPMRSDYVSIDSTRAMARLFAVYAPALRTVFLHDVDLPHLHGGWAIDRDEAGKPLPRMDMKASEEEEGYHYGSVKNKEGWKFSEREMRGIPGI
ncbi:hypothetical protein BD626DRAFT_494681 [Schizophyllum amplum]|uniref:F-box domain-containing protein n=1 Tax=Schizophyllum amplum TaxID=97359 RepID=A0A550CFH7_9AGAR|nr:hypothetical protein BD626DRAFT_494681 [Auriculariopsis ampla]